METDRSVLISKLSYISHIIPYYGYIHESAELLGLLSKTTKKIWETNVKAITLVVMNNKQSRMILRFQSNFTMKNVKFLMENFRYLYFWLQIIWETRPSIKALESLIEKAIDAPSFLFNKVEVKVKDKWISLWNKVSQVYLDKRLDIYALDTLSYGVQNFSNVQYYKSKIIYSDDYKRTK